MLKTINIQIFYQGEQERRPVTPEEDDARSPSTSSMSPTPTQPLTQTMTQHFNAKVKTSNDGSERGTSPRGKNDFDW